MNQDQLSEIKNLLILDKTIVIEIMQASSDQRVSLIKSLSTQHNIKLSDSDINAISEDPSQIFDGLELDDDELALAAGGGKGDTKVRVTGSVNNSSIRT